MRCIIRKWRRIFVSYLATAGVLRQHLLFAFLIMHRAIINHEVFTKGKEKKEKKNKHRIFLSNCDSAYFLYFPFLETNVV